MDAHGRAECGEEQMLWAYMLGKAAQMKEDHPNAAPGSMDLKLTKVELQAMYRAVTGQEFVNGIARTKAGISWLEVKRWVVDLQNLLPYFKDPRI